jgi:hypothetical protein
LACVSRRCSSRSCSRACWGQAALAPKFNTASAGVRADDIEAAVNAICAPRDIVRSKDGSASGCRVCPKGTDFYGDGIDDWGMYAETPGHFTSPQDDNLLLDGARCDSHASNWGGSFMFTVKSGEVRLLKYDRGLHTDECHKFAFPDGRDFLICRGGSTYQGESTEMIFMAAFDAAGSGVTTKLISAMDTANTCLGEIKFSPAESGRSQSPGKSVEITGLTITAMQGTTDCAASQNATAGKLRRNIKSYEIEFLFDGKNFTVAPASRVALRRFDTN